MFYPPKRQTIIAVFALFATLAISAQAMAWQSSEFERRAAALQRARARSGQSMVVPAAHAETVPEKTVIRKTAKNASVSARASATRASVQRTTAPVRQQQARPVTRVASRSISTNGSNVKPTHVAQMIHGGETIVGGPTMGGHTMGGSVIEGGVVGSNYGGGEIISSGPMSNSYSQPVYENVIHDQSYGGYSSDCGCSTDYGISTGSCSSGTCGGGDCCGRGGCPEGPCWLGNFGKALRTGEYFGGATAFQSPLFTSPGQDLPINDNNLASDSSFGFYGGFNLGIPLCRLSCGYLSGQFGMRSVTTNFNGNEFTPEDRRQLFVTAGLYRRVDYGLQFGVVADILHEEWFTESDLVQIRSDIGWVYAGGHTFGFRYATGVQDDFTQGTFNGNDFTDFFQTTDDNYRFYYRHMASWGGYGEAFIGWGEASQTIIGVDVDVPVTDRISFQSGFSAYLNDDVVADTSNFQGGNLNEAWNLFVGISFKPQGRAWYKSYDRPLFSVADNGTMLVRRQSPEITE